MQCVPEQAWRIHVNHVRARGVVFGVEYGSAAASSSGAGECAAEGGGTVAGGAEAGLAAEMARGAVSAAPSAEAVVDVPSFFGKTMVLLVGKRMQDRKHQIWLPSVHDPYSFRTPQDELPQGGASESPSIQRLPGRAQP